MYALLVQEGLSSLAHRTFSSSASAAATALDPLKQQYVQQYALAQRVKFIVDAPEVLYGCMDVQEYLKAAKHYLQVRYSRMRAFV